MLAVLAQAPHARLAIALPCLRRGVTLTSDQRWLDASRDSRTPVVFDVSVLHPPVNDKLLLIDGPRYDGSTIVASLEDGLAYPNPNQDFDNSTTRRQDRGTRAPLAGDHRIGSPPCSATRWAYRMRDDGGVI